MNRDRSILKKTGIAIASLVLIAFACAAAWYAVQYYEPSERDAKAEAKDQQKKIVADILSSERVAYYTKVLAIFTGALGAFGVVQLFFLIRADGTAAKTAEAALRGAKAAEDSTQAANRPWLMLSKMEIRTLRFLENGGLNVEVRPTIRNIGKFPATNVRIEYALVDLPRQPDEELSALRSRMATINRNFPGQVVFPGTKQSPAWFVVQLDKMMSPNGHGTGVAQLFLVGCISYEFALSDKIHQTPFSGHIWKLVNGHIGGSADIGIDLGEGEVTYNGEIGMLSSQRPT